MMQSVALLDSFIVPNDDEWIVLHPSSISSPAASSSCSDDDRLLGDDNSYDYCDDAYSVLSNKGADDQSTYNDFLGDGIPRPANIQDEIFGETSDESAAKSGDQVDTLLQDILESSMTREEYFGLGAAMNLCDSPMAPTLIESGLEESGATEDSQGLNFAPRATTIEDDLSVASSSYSCGPYSCSGDDKKSSSYNSSKVDSIADEFEQATQRSRLSSKKRRKQLKLNKKSTATTAGAAAAVAIARINLAVPVKKHINGVGKNKKQVGIALQAIASYKEEVHLSNIKSKKLFR